MLMTPAMRFHRLSGPMVWWWLATVPRRWFVTNRAAPHQEQWLRCRCLRQLKRRLRALAHGSRPGRFGAYRRRQRGNRQSPYPNGDSHGPEAAEPVLESVKTVKSLLAAETKGPSRLP